MNNDNIDTPTRIDLPNTVEVNGNTYEVDKLSPTAKNLLLVYAKWVADRDDAIAELDRVRLVVAKNEAALRDLSNEIRQLIRDDEKTSSS